MSQGQMFPSRPQRAPTSHGSTTPSLGPWRTAAPKPLASLPHWRRTPCGAARKYHGAPWPKDPFPAAPRIRAQRSGVLVSQASGHDPPSLRAGGGPSRTKPREGTNSLLPRTAAHSPSRAGACLPVAREPAARESPSLGPNPFYPCPDESLPLPHFPNFGIPAIRNSPSRSSTPWCILTSTGGPLSPQDSA